MTRIKTTLLIIALSLIGLMGGVFIFLLNYPLVDLASHEYETLGKPSIVLDDAEREIFRFQLDKREPIKLSQAPAHLINAFLATEDVDFYNHHGISFRGIARSVLVNLYHGRVVQGASTITQQLVRLLYISSEQTITRKLKEQFLAIVIEMQHTKEQILEAYLNNIYLGAGIYGVQAAARRFWNTTATNLRIDQAAMLAAIIKNPQRYCPLYNPKEAIRRRNLVLQQMEKRGFITNAEYRKALRQQLGTSQQMAANLAEHLKEFIRASLENMIGKHDLYTKGLVIRTTINRRFQLHAETVFKRHVGAWRKNIPCLDGALVSIDTSTAGIKALVGGYDFSESEYNRAVQAQRQMGSMFKPIVYAAALEHGHTFTDIFVDEPLTGVVQEDWDPHNVHKEFEGPMTLANALITSNNIISIKLLLEMGAESVVEMARRFHLPGPLNPYPSLALGCTECSPVQAAAMMNTIVKGGVYTKPYLIEWVKDQWGAKLWKHVPEEERVLSWQTSSQLIGGLKLVANHLHNRHPNSWIDEEVIGKTGTTNENRTCSFLGATPRYTTAIFLGCDDNSPMEDIIYSASHGVALWLAYNKGLPMKHEQPTKFYVDPSLQTVIVNKTSGQTDAPGNPNAIELLVPQPGSTNSDLPDQQVVPVVDQQVAGQSQEVPVATTAPSAQ
jgi:penicillin-binding protein 1A